MSSSQREPKYHVSSLPAETHEISCFGYLREPPVELTEDLLSILKTDGVDIYDWTLKKLITDAVIKHRDINRVVALNDTTFVTASCDEMKFWSTDTFACTQTLPLYPEKKPNHWRKIKLKPCADEKHFVGIYSSYQSDKLRVFIIDSSGKKSDIKISGCKQYFDFDFITNDILLVVTEGKAFFIDINLAKNKLSVRSTQTQDPIFRQDLAKGTVKLAVAPNGKTVVIHTPSVSNYIWTWVYDIVKRKDKYILESRRKFNNMFQRTSAFLANSDLCFFRSGSVSLSDNSKDWTELERFYEIKAADNDLSQVAVLSGNRILTIPKTSYATAAECRVFHLDAKLVDVNTVRMQKASACLDKLGMFKGPLGMIVSYLKDEKAAIFYPEKEVMLRDKIRRVREEIDALRLDADKKAEVQQLKIDQQALLYCKKLLLRDADNIGGCIDNTLKTFVDGRGRSTLSFDMHQFFCEMLEELQSQPAALVRTV